MLWGPVLTDEPRYGPEHIRGVKLACGSRLPAHPHGRRSHLLTDPETHFKNRPIGGGRSSQLAFRRVMVVADSPGASGPSRAPSAWLKWAGNKPLMSLAGCGKTAIDNGMHDFG